MKLSSLALTTLVLGARRATVPTDDPAPMSIVTCHLFSPVHVLLLACVLLGSTSVTWGQTHEIFNEHRVQPEVWNFPQPKEPGVGATGDLSLSVPVMTVPGRGIDFPISFNYSSGITYTQQASWIGLGWNFDPGSITREVEGGTRYLIQSSIMDHSHGVDAWDDGTLPENQPDIFFATLPGYGTVEITRINWDDYSTTTIPQYSYGELVVDNHKPWAINATWSDDPQTGSAGMTVAVDQSVGESSCIEGMSACVTGHTSDGNTNGEPFSERPDIEQFEITTDDGTRYVFGTPTLSFFDKRPDIHHDNLYVGQIERQLYVSTWRLVAILGPDFDNRNGGNPLVPDDADTGSWVRFYYTTAYNDFPSADVGQWTTIKGVRQTRYLTAIETPTHKAYFDLATRNTPYNVDGIDEDMFKRLTAIRLKRKIGDNEVLIEQVQLEQTNKVGETYSHPLTGSEASTLGPYDGSSGVYDGRLTLHGIRFFGQSNAERPGYYFAYSENPTPIYASENNIFNCLDDFGYMDFTDHDCPWNQDQLEESHDPDAWSLTDVWYPTGGHDQVVYEQDLVDGTDSVKYERREVVLSQGNNHYNLAPGYYCFEKDLAPYPVLSNFCPTSEAAEDELRRRAGGGVRVQQITRDPGVGVPVQIDYTYGPGYLSGIPFRHWHVVADNLNDNIEALFKPSNRGKVFVMYDWVDRRVGGTHGTETHYTTPGTAVSLGAYPLTTFATQRECGGEACFDLAVIQGDEHRYWGIPYKTRHYRLDGETKTTLQVQETTLETATYGGNQKKVAQIWGNTGSHDSDAQVGMNLGAPRRTSVVTRTWSADGTGSPATTRTNYGYDDRTGYVTLTEERVYELGTIDPTWRITEKTYAYEQYSGMQQDNILRPVVAEDVGERAGDSQAPSGSTLYYTSSRTTWSTFFPAGGEGFYRPDAVYRWHADSPSANRPSTDSNAEWIQENAFTDYDKHGRVTEQHDALGNVTSFIYGTNDSNFSNMAGPYLTGLRGGTNPELSIAYDYNVWGLPSSVRDENGHYTCFDYDDFGRLSATRSIDGSTCTSTGTALSEHAYPTGSVGTVPSYVQTTTHLDGSTQTITKTFFDGLAREIQTQVRDSDSTHVVSATEYDAGGRVWKQWKPYRANTGGSYDGGFAAQVGDEYEASCGGTPTAPYTETLYMPDPLGRVDQVISPHCNSDDAASIQNTYGVEGNFRYTLVTDENAHQTKTTTDGFDNTVETVGDVGGIGATTSFDYDVLGNLTQVRDPNDYVTAYQYNTLSQLTNKTTPDADDAFSYTYDDNGNLRFVVDPKRQGGGYLYTDYDGFDRVVESGLCTSGDPDSEDPNAATLCSNREEVVTYTYDTVPPNPPITINNPEAHLTKADVDGDVYFYSYDDDGRVEALHVALAGLTGKTITYAYDRQGNVTDVQYQPDDPAEALAVRYHYDEAGRLQRVESKVLNETAYRTEAVYQYTATGQVRQLKLGATPVQTVDYAYHIRDWLTQINALDQVGSDSWADKFGLELGYDQPIMTGAPTYLNGNVASMAWATDGSNDPASELGYTFAYDGLNRLVGADYLEGGGSWNKSESTYEVPTVTYDDNGNLTQLVRYHPDQSSYEIDYTYAPGTNRLQSVSGAVGASFTYDANGNMTQGRTFDGATYDRRNLPTTMMMEGDALTFRYDADGQRVYKRLDRADGSSDETYYLRGVDGSVLAVYRDVGNGPQLAYWNILSGGRVIGRVEPPAASGTN